MVKPKSGFRVIFAAFFLVALQVRAEEPEHRWSGDLQMSGSFTRHAQVVSRSGRDIRVDFGKMFDPRNTSSRQKTVRLSIVQSGNDIYIDLGGGCLGELVPSPEVRPPRSAKGLESYTIDFATTGAPIRCAQDSRRAGLSRQIFAARKSNAWQVSLEEHWEGEGSRPGRGSLKGRGWLRPVRSADGGSAATHVRRTTEGMSPHQSEEKPLHKNPLSIPAPARLATGPNQGQPASVRGLIEFNSMMSLLNSACEDPATTKSRITKLVNSELSSNQRSIAPESWRAFDLLGYSKLGDLCTVRTALAQCNPLPEQDAKARCDCTAGIVGKSRVGPGIPTFLLKANAFIAWDACDRARAVENDQSEHNRYELQMARAGNFLQTGFRSSVAKKVEEQFPIDAKIELAWIQLDELYSSMSAVFPPLTKDQFYAQVNRTIAAIRAFEKSDPAEAATIYTQLGALIRTGESTARMTRAAGSILFPPPSSLDNDLEAMVRVDAHHDFLRYQSMIKQDRPR